MAETATTSTRQSIFLAPGNKKFIDPANMDGFDKVNVLHAYNSYSYKWTMAAITKSQSSDPTFFANEDQKFPWTVFVSSGKGNTRLDSTSVEKVYQTDAEGNRTANDAATKDLQALVAEFNSKGIGRFDFYLENAEITTSWGPAVGANLHMVQLTVVEPLSLNGFIEALRVNALAAGWENYQHAVFVLKLEFWGWKIGKDGTIIGPEKAPKASRFFPITINGLTVDNSDSGTKYQLTCASQNGFALSNDGRLQTGVKMKGATVKEVLEDLKTNVNEQFKQDNGNDDAGTTTKNFNEIDIVFEKFTNKDGTAKLQQLIETAKINDFLRAAQVYNFGDPGGNDPKSNYKLAQPADIPYDKNSESVQFAQGSLIIDIITAVVRDSQYSEEIIKNLETYKNSDGFVPWFRVYVTVETKSDSNTQEQRPTRKYVYHIKPYYVHCSKIPGQAIGTFSVDNFAGYIRRAYNYLYTGYNVDLLNFSMKFNHLYFQPKPYKMGDQDRSGTTVGGSPTNAPKIILPSQDANGVGKRPAEAGQAVQQITDPNAVIGATDSNGKPLTGKAQQITPYMALAKTLHDAILDNGEQQSMDITIVGDPYYLVTSNFGNIFQVADPAKPGETRNGEADYMPGSVYISIDFRIPRDIREDGFMDFGEDSSLLPYSGVFEVRSTSHHFRDGQFTQSLQINRLPGQILSTKPANKPLPLQLREKPGEQKAKGTEPSSVSDFGATRQFADLTNLLSKAPTLGLPGLLTAGLGGLFGQALSGLSNTLQSSVRRVDAAIAETLAPVNSAAAFVGQTVTFAAQVGGLVAVANAMFSGQQSGTNTVGQNINGYDPLTNGIPVITGSPASSTAQTQASIAAQAAILNPSFVENTRYISQLNQNYKNTYINSGINYATTPSPATNLNNAGPNVLSSTNGTAVDPTALATQLGIDPAQVSGLDPNTSQNILLALSAILSLVPTDANIQAWQNFGLSMKNVFLNSIPKLPATQPATVADGDRDPSYIANKQNEYDIQQIIATGGNPSNLPGALGLASVAGLVALLELGKNSGSGSAGSALDGQAIVDKLVTDSNLSNALITGDSTVPPAILGLGSQESNLANANSIVQGYGGYYVIPKTYNSQFGTQRTVSPIDQLMLTKANP